MAECIVFLEDSTDGYVWLADGDGDPPRCLKPENARRFRNRHEAWKGLREARQYRPFRRAQIADADNPVLVFDRE